ncbi:MAG TPA: hypothetical protein VI911_12010 [Patescibacteria group bacterium]|nr:hypothetical protein [Patescibacteria group bacterium]
MDNQVLYDLLKEVRDEQRRHGDELSYQSAALNFIREEVKVNTVDLKEHKEGVIQNREALRILKEDFEKSKKEIDSEIDKLKEPDKFKSWMYGKYVKIAGIITVTTGVIAGIFKVLSYFKVI